MFTSSPRHLLCFTTIQMTSGQGEWGFRDGPGQGFIFNDKMIIIECVSWILGAACSL